MSQGTIFDWGEGDDNGRDRFSIVPLRGREYPGSCSVEEAREFVRDALRRDTQANCPTCGQDVKLYARKLHANLARTIIRLYRAGGEHDFVHAPSLRGDTHEASQLSWWKLAVSERERRPDGGKSGFWRLTPLGVEYVLNRARIPYHARVFDAHCFHLEGEPQSIIDALKDPFHYRELMGWE